MQKVNLFWFRRDLRLEDNVGLFQATKSDMPVIPIFIFDENILNNLPKNDARVNFIYESLQSINEELTKLGSSIRIEKGTPIEIWKKLIKEYSINEVFFNRDYEPYARERDKEVYELLTQQGIKTHSYKDQVIFEKSEVVKKDGSPYTVYTPFKKKWRQQWEQNPLITQPVLASRDGFAKHNFEFPTKEKLGIFPSKQKVNPYSLTCLPNYAERRDIPSRRMTDLGVHLRFGTVGVRTLISENKQATTFVDELIWREFFSQILYHFPSVVSENFKPKYDGIKWRNDKTEFEKWKQGKTGYPLVDAGMRELNQTGYMHNRVRMVTASFLIKHLLIDWRWGEAYFAEKLLDFDLASNNGNWQWVAGTGCDAAPYFRVFNPTEQAKKFDKEQSYIRRWIPEWNTKDYPTPMVDHKMARERVLLAYKEGINT